MAAERGPKKPPVEPGPDAATGKPGQHGPDGRRAARVDRIRERCDNGRYAVPSRKVADKIVNDAVARIRKRQK